MLDQYLPLVMFTAIAILIAVGVLFVASFLGPKVSSKHKFDVYECGMDQLDAPHKPFSVKFYAVALIFMLLDIETIFLLPWAIGFKEYGTDALIAVALFILIPALGLAYVIKSGALKWD